MNSACLPKTSALLCVAALSIGALAGCTSPSQEPAGEETGDLAEGVDELNAGKACGAKYGEALEHYKFAVSLAKDPYAAGRCAEDSDIETTFEDEAATAVMLCPAFKDVIRNSKWAAPIRNALADVLTLRSLTGELLVLRNTEYQNWSNVEQYFPGTKMWAVGAWGSFWMQDELRFLANGQAEHVHFVEAEDDAKGGGLVVEQKTPATYTIEKIDGEKDNRQVTVSWGGKKESFVLIVSDTEPGDFTSAPVFSLRHVDAQKSFSTSKDCSM